MFQDQQYMELVSHVSSCPYMNQGLYDCPYCNKEERFCWDVSYFQDNKGDLAVANSMPLPYESHMAPTAPQIAMNDSTHQFQSDYAENDNKPFPEVFLNDPRASRSPNPSHVDSGKRKYDQLYEPTYTAGSSNETISVTNGEYTQSQGRLSQHSAYMVELPSPNTAGHGSTHLSPQPSPEILSRNAPSIGQAMQMGMGNYGMVGRDPSQMMAGFDPSQVTLMGPMMGASVPTLRASPAGNGQTVSPGGRERGMSNASIVPSQGSPRQRPSSGRVGASMQNQDMISGSMPRAVGSESSSGGAAEAEKGSVTCKQCGKVLRGKVAWLPSNLQRHMREIHLSAPKTECRVCGRTFNRGHNLRHHMKAVHGEQP